MVRINRGEDKKRATACSSRSASSGSRREAAGRKGNLGTQEGTRGENEGMGESLFFEIKSDSDFLLVKQNIIDDFE